MAFSVEVAKTTFAAGELSPEMRVRSDLAKNQTGCWFLENMVVLLEGGVTRRPGTQMVMPYKDPTQTADFVPFRFSGSGSNAYLIVINGGAARFVLGNAVVVIGGGNNDPYEVAVPYTDADLGGAGAASPGVSNLYSAYEGNVVWLFCDGHAPNTLTRNADNSWTLAPYVTQPSVPSPQGGCIAPIANENLDPAQTIGASAVSGNITLTASAGFSGAGGTVPNGFQQGHVGSVWRLDESNLALTPEWSADENVSPPVSVAALGSAFGNMTNNSHAIDTVAADAATSTTGAGYVGGLMTSAPIVSVLIAPPTSGAFSSAGAVDLISFQLYGKNGTPGSGTDGVLLGSGACAGNAANITINSNDAITDYTDVWVNWVNSVSGATISIHMTVSVSTGAAVLRRFNGNVYQALNAGNAGANSPVHTSGEVLSGQGGVNWLYVHRDRGFVLITAVADSRHASAIVLERLPDSVVAQATANWWPSAWDGINGWPDRVRVINNSLFTTRQNKFWITQPGTFNNFDITDPTSAQSAIYGTLVSPNGSLAWIEAIMRGPFTAVLTRDEEWVFAGQNPFNATTIQNLDPYPTGQTGSAQHKPDAAEGGLVCINRSRDRALFRELDFNGVMPRVKEEELTISARHILKRRGGGALGVSRQQDPNNINWFWCANGLVVGNSLMKEQQVNGWHRHPQHAATQSQVERMATIPSNDEGVSWTYLATKRTINGTLARFVELLQPFFLPPASNDEDSPDDDATAENAWFLDCALQYQGVATPRLTGLNHLANTQVAVHADGCTLTQANGQPFTVAADGSLELPRLTTNAIVGLPISYRIRLLPLDLTTPKGSTAGAAQKANHLFLRVVNSRGGYVAVNPREGGPADRIEYPGGDFQTFGDPIPLYTGVIRTPGLQAPVADECIVEISGSDTMPFTLSGVDPDIIVEESD